ncbi:hypothetical protein LCGC14_1104990 [marine sediment metagenome]|uniref:Uncharacterized protein n=1 Tax=marine sediment metagenome TaxID=412755 RepID=A0A0F9PRH7_9ZZZZ
MEVIIMSSKFVKDMKKIAKNIKEKKVRNDNKSKSKTKESRKEDL